jgi:hypothetical protein
VSAGDLRLDYLKEAKAVVDIYYEDIYPDDEVAGKRTADRMLIEGAVCALVSIAESLHRIVEEESQ